MAKSTTKKKIIKASDSKIRNAIEAGDGILRLAPTWVPRSFLMPGRRIKLAPQDLYAYGAIVGALMNDGLLPPHLLPTKIVKLMKATAMLWLMANDPSCSKMR